MDDAAQGSAAVGNRADDGTTGGAAVGAADGVAVRGGHTALLVALGVDNFGSGLFLPLVVVYITSVVGVPLSLAGVLVTAGTVVGLLAPPVAGRLVDRIGPRAVVVASQVLQAAGMTCYLLAAGPLSTLLAAALVAAGTQTFYSALFALIADVAPPGPKDHSFAVVDMVRSAAFGIGALGSSVLLALASSDGLRVAVVIDAVTFLGAAGLLAALVHPRDHTTTAPQATTAVPTATAETATAAAPAAAELVPGPASELALTRALDVDAPGTRPAPPPGLVHVGPVHVGPVHVGPVWTNRPFVGLIVTCGLLGLTSDVFLVGLPVYALDRLHTPTWVPGACLGLLTALSATATTTVVRRTRHWARTSTMAAGALCLIAWAAAAAAAAWLPPGWASPWLLTSTLLLAAGALLFGTRANALAEAAAPPNTRGRHLAAFQYAFTAAMLLAPLLVSAFAVATWLPWLLVALAAAAGGTALLALAPHLPAHAVRPHPAPEQEREQKPEQVPDPTA